MAELMRLAEGSKDGPDVIDVEVLTRMLTEGPNHDGADRSDDDNTA